jgi:uncharacterized protein (DUF58 family)
VNKTQQTLKHRFWQEHFFRWIDKRHPIANSHRLHRKNLYIFPSITGIAYLFLCLIVWLLGTNYQNNLILALAYMQISIFVLTILNTYHNLAGLQIQLLSADPGFVGEKMTFHLLFSTANAEGSHYVTAQWQNELPVIFDFEPGQEQREKVYAQARVRGWLRPGRLLVKSTFPMGLLRCWTWLKFDAEALVYPAPVLSEMPIGTTFGEEEQGRHVTGQKGDEFLGFRAYRPGDSLKHVAWKQYARDQGLMSKEYGELTSSRVWLQWQDFYQGDRELCLSNLCFWALRLNEQQKEFGLRLPGREIPPASGAEHLAQVLRSLALFEGAA